MGKLVRAATQTWHTRVSRQAQHSIHVALCAQHCRRICSLLLGFKGIAAGMADLCMLSLQMEVGQLLLQYVTQTINNVLASHLLRP